MADCLRKLLFAAAMILLAPSSPLVAQTVSEQYLLSAANRERAAAGLAPVLLNAELAAAARTHALEMARQRSISHQFPGEPDLLVRVDRAGAHVSRVTENVAEGANAALLHELWMHSPGHRANLLDGRVDAVGVAVIVRAGQLYAVEDFAHTVAPLSLPDQESAVSRLLRHEGLAIEVGTEKARQSCARETGSTGERRPAFTMRWTADDLGRLPPELTAHLRTRRYHEAEVGACRPEKTAGFSAFSLAVLLYP